MAEYIKREDAIEVAEKYGLANGSVLGRHTGLADCIADEIATIPVVDVEEVKHGHWVFDARTIAPRCSVCGEDAIAETVSPYCPWCGANCDEEDENGRG